MKDLYNSMKAVIGFLFIMILISSFFGDKSAEHMALFILLGMILLNADAFTKFLNEKGLIG